MDPAALRHHFDNLDPEFHAEFWESLVWMRTECPVALSDRHGGFWFVTRYDDVRSVCEDWRRFTSTQGLAIPPAPMPPLPPISVDPPEQRDWRHLLNPYFAPASLAHLEPRIREVADRFVDDFVEDGRCDIVADFASVFPGAVFFELHPRSRTPRCRAVASCDRSRGGPDRQR